MVATFPSISVTSMKDAQPGSVVAIARSGGPWLALVTDHFTNGVRSFVWLNPNFPDKPAAIFIEGWRDDPSIICYGNDARFEIALTKEVVDPNGRAYWETAGVVVSINEELFIRAAPEDQFYGRYRLVNIRNGALYPERPPETLWTFFSWQLWIRDPERRSDLMLTKFGP